MTGRLVDRVAVLGTFATLYPNGATDQELAHFLRRDVNSCRRRRLELENEGHIAPQVKARPTVWVITPLGMSAYERELLARRKARPDTPSADQLDIFQGPHHD